MMCTSALPRTRRRCPVCCPAFSAVDPAALPQCAVPRWTDGMQATPFAFDSACKRICILLDNLANPCSHTGCAIQVLECDAFDWCSGDACNLPAALVAPDSLAYIIFTSGSVSAHGAAWHVVCMVCSTCARPLGCGSGAGRLVDHDWLCAWHSPSLSAPLLTPR